MGRQPILPIKVSVTIDKMLNFGGDFDGHSNGDFTCKQTLTNMFQNQGITDSFLLDHLILQKLQIFKAFNEVTTQKNSECNAVGKCMLVVHTFPFPFVSSIRRRVFANLSLRCEFVAGSVCKCDPGIQSVSAIK